MASKQTASRNPAQANTSKATTVEVADRTGGRGNAALLAEIAEASEADGDDDYVRDTIGPSHLEVATAAQKAAMIRNLLDGDTGDEDEQTILRILRSPEAKATLDALEKAGHMQWLLDDVNGEEFDELEVLLASIEKTYQDALAQRAAAPRAAIPEAATPEAATPEAATPEATTAKPATPLSKEREQALNEAERRMESVAGATGADGKRKGAKPKLNDAHGKPRTDTENLFSGTKDQTSGTSCGLLPATVLAQMGLAKNDRVKAITAYVTSGGPGGMEELADKYDAWIPSTGTNKPRPGDIFVVNNPEGEFAHVGIIRSADDHVWVTLNAGGGRGAGDKTLAADRHIMTTEEKDAYNKSLMEAPKSGGGTKEPTIDQKAARKAAVLNGSQRPLTQAETAKVNARIPKALLDVKKRYMQGNGNTPDAPSDEPRMVRGWVDLDRLVAYANGGPGKAERLKAEAPAKAPGS